MNLALNSTKTISDLDDLETVLFEVQNLFNGVLAMWRGHADCNYQLIPEVFRARPSGGLYNETSLIRHFMARAISRKTNCPVESDRLGWLLLARHFGLPTRLLIGRKVR